VDIVGTCVGLDWLQVEQVISSPHPIGGGWVSTEHGQLAVPVPAVIELWEMGHVPVFSNGVEAELVTPTGAALAVALAEEFGPCPPLRLEKVGRGLAAVSCPFPTSFAFGLVNRRGMSRPRLSRSYKPRLTISTLK
jgi:uncharacterized protein (DUF111 family)